MPDNAASPVKPPAFPWLSAAAWSSLLCLAVLLLSFAWYGPDIFYHLFLGRGIVEHRVVQPPDNLMLEQPTFVNIYWLFQLLCYAFYALGDEYAVSLLFIGVWTAVFVLSVRASRLWKIPGPGIPLSLVALLVMQTRFDIRPETFSYLFLILQLYWLTHWSFDAPLPSRRYVFFFASEVLWANMHGYFILGPFLVGAMLLSALRERRGRDSLRRISVLLAVTLAATVASPLGTDTWRCVIILWEFLREMHGAVYEFRPPTTEDLLRLWTVKLFWIYWSGTILTGAWLAWKRRLRLFDLLTTAAGLYLSATSFRNIPLLPLLSAPLWSRLSAGRIDEAPLQGTQGGPGGLLSAGGKASIALSALFSLGLSAWVAGGGFHASLYSETDFGIRLLPSSYPVHFREYLSNNPFKGRLFNHSSDGGYLEFHFPALRLYADSRFTDAQSMRGYFEALNDPEAFRRLNARHDFDGVLLRVTENRQLIENRLRDPAWKLVFADLHRFFLVNGQSSAGREMAAVRPAFYRGEDLAKRINGMAAILLVDILIRTDRRGLLKEALDQFARAPAIPSFVIEFSLRHGLGRQDKDVIGKARRLYPRMIALEPAHRATVDELLRLADARRL